MENEKFYTTKQAAEKYMVVEQTLRNAIKNKKLKASQVSSGKSPTGFIYRIAESDLEKFMEDRKMRKTTIPNVTDLTIDDLAEEILKRIRKAHDEGFKEGKKAAKEEFLSALKGVK